MCCEEYCTHLPRWNLVAEQPRDSNTVLYCASNCSSHSMPFSYHVLQSFQTSKKLMRDHHRRLLEEVNAKECALLKERWLHEECMQAIMSFFQRKEKSKL